MGTATRSPLDEEDLLIEILLRLPPLPSSLPRASLVCKLWRRIISDRSFLRRFRDHNHRRPPLLGLFFHRRKGVRFVPTLEPPDRIPATRFCLPHTHEDGWFFCGCHRGLALLYSILHRQAVVWEPLTGNQRSVAFPPGFNNIEDAAVLCSSPEGDCKSASFIIVLVRSTTTHAVASVYDSESNAWGDTISTPVSATGGICCMKPSTLAGNGLYWLLVGGNILEFDLQKLSLAEIEKPAALKWYDYSNIQVVRTEDGSLGLATLSGFSMLLWEMKADSDGFLGWVLQKTIQLDKVLSLEGTDEDCIVIWGYTEDSNMIFVSAEPDIFMIQLDTVQFKSLSRSFYITRYYPYSSFFPTDISL
ncbi:putative F-box protein At3g49980 [Lolium rigidum]|uniref:putative F-box protein At3g49980 n=1 Tax=Lolium rigidum TaxID=89674 RepID=UPI001F5C3E80|nr:putative F-box protein At3g49980 [Lolium rigidum]